MWTGQDSPTGIYMQVSNLDSRETYPGNTATDFQVTLPKDLNLITYNVALCDIFFQDVSRIDHKHLPLHVCCDIVQPSWHLGRWQNVIRSLSASDLTSGHIKFERLHYINCKNVKATSLHVYILDSERHKIAQVRDTRLITSVTLHFVKQGLQSDMANLELKTSVQLWKKHFKEMISNTSGPQKSSLIVGKATGHGVTSNGSISGWTGQSRPITAIKRKRRAKSKATGGAKRRKTASKAKGKKRDTKKKKVTKKKKKAPAKKRKSSPQKKKKKTNKKKTKSSLLN